MLTGFRAAALFALREPPEGTENPEAWLAEYDRVLAFREQGQDPGGHMPPMPHLCVNDPMKVCNCCPTCACVPEKAPAAPEALNLHQLLMTLPRIAYALETLALQGRHFPNRGICKACGYSLCDEEKARCPVCGSV